MRHFSQQKTPVPSSKKTQAKPLLDPWAIQIPPYSASELPPTPRGAARLGMWQSWKCVHLFGWEALSCLSDQEETNAAVCNPALEDAPRGQATGGGHQLAPCGPRCLPDSTYPFFPVTAPLNLVAQFNGRLPSPPICPVRPPHRQHLEPQSPRLPPGVVLKSVPPGVVL